MDILQWVPLLGAAGIGSVITSYVGAGKARREVRSAVLEALAMTEGSRWAGLDKDHPTFKTASRDFETAALIARIPRPAVQQYLVLADAARRYSVEDYAIKGCDEEIGAGAINSDLGNVVQESAEIVTQLAWRPWWSRVTYRVKLRKVRNKATDIDNKDVRQQLVYAQWALTRSPGSLGELYDEYFSDRKKK
ncbi:hypothetical protein MMRN_37730 [Mycobacterium marinum]|uniref:hypothetical protein n=1 Tax=Mycobacterium marinum TaxID=1781 RepID=UPI000CD9E0EB|nr:hypothetical protein [Mycobacterium marinum]WOR02928.1 hypothetical protein QDR78_17070 [Mycobacterium marinum]BBC66877.1 hypothetical protein MMRN_37730 [Mycobacterium marinum]